MDYKSTLQYCLNKSGAFEDYPFGPEPTVVKVGSKMFAIISARDGRCFVSLKCDPFIAQTLRQQYPGVQPGYHLNKEHWNTVALDGTVPENEVKWMIDHSFELVNKS